MLQAIHDKAKGWIAYTIVGFITIPFALWGINSYLEGGQNPPAAVVNGEEIPGREVQNQLGQIRQQFGQLAAPMGDDALKGMALDSVVGQVLMRQKAQENGYRASSDEVIKTIADIEAFQKDGRFDPATYDSFLKMQRRTQNDFERQVREDLTLGQFRQGVTDTAFIPKTQLEHYQSLRTQKREIEFYTLKVADFEAQVQITDEQIAKYYDENKSRFMTEEKVKLAYLELDQDKLAEGIVVDEAKLQAYYDENLDRYTSPESRNVSHILAAVAEPKPELEAIAKQRIDAIYADIQAAKKTFEDAARTDSDDKAAADNAGLVGDVSAGLWDPEFEKAVLALEPNTVSAPVKTGAGYEILRVNSVKAAAQQSFADARAQVEADYRRAEAEKLFTERAEQVQTLAYEQSGDLGPAAKAAAVAVADAGWVTRSKGEGIAAHPKVREAAFADDVIKDGKNSEPIAISDTQLVVVRSTGVEPAAQRPLADVREDILKVLTAQEARKLVAQKGADLLKQVATAGWSALDNSGLGKAEAVEKPGLIQRTGSTVSPEVMGRAFALARPASGQVGWDGVVLNTGDYAVLALKTVENGPATLNEADTKSLSAALGMRELGAAVQDLQDRAEIVRNPKNI